MEQMGRFEDACEVYKSYAHINDSIRSAELDEQLSKYTVQFEVDKLEHDVRNCGRRSTAISL